MLHIEEGCLTRASISWNSVFFGTGDACETDSDKEALSEFRAAQFHDVTQGTDALAPLQGDWNENAAGGFVREISHKSTVPRRPSAL